MRLLNRNKPLRLTIRNPILSASAGKEGKEGKVSSLIFLGGKENRNDIFDYAENNSSQTFPTFPTFPGIGRRRQDWRRMSPEIRQLKHFTAPPRVLPGPGDAAGSAHA
jgi:hypothetical protein